jgi:long-chain acyl-CoA synthetase
MDYALIIAEGRSCVSALLFPDREYIERYIKRKELEISLEEYLVSKKVHKQVAALIKHTNKHLDEWEQIRHYRFVTDEISIENGDLTPSMKLCRYRVIQRFNQKIEEMYS